MTVFTVIASGDEFLSVIRLNEITEGINERAGVLSLGGVSTVIAGDDVQSAAFWANLQNTIEALVPYFVNHTLYGGDYTGLAAIPMFTLATWRTEAGLHSDGFTAINETATYHRIIEAGDYINKHLINEMADGLSVLKWTIADSYWDTQGEDAGNSYDGYWATEALAKAGAQTGYDSGYATVPGPMAYTILNNPSTWFARVYRAYSYLRMDTVDINKDIDFYVIGEKVGDSFDDNGDFGGGYVEGELYKFDSIADSTDTTVYSSKFGLGPPGNYPVWPTSPDDQCGYQISGAYCVVKWDFEWN